LRHDDDTPKLMSEGFDQRRSGNLEVWHKSLTLKFPFSVVKR
jgi:hypothetical protein